MEKKQVGEFGYLDYIKKKNILNPVLKNSHIEKLYIFAPAFGKRSEETINIQYNILQKT